MCQIFLQRKASCHDDIRQVTLGKNPGYCQGTACHVNGSEMIAQAISEQLNIKDGETTEDGLFTINQVSCLGCCSLAPVMMIKTEDGDETYGNLTKDSVIEIINQIKEKEKKADGETA